ncbi:T9SS type A sorting domain-containing protein [Marinigracilibium pacificum]|uniref:T9SS type A sorting domain-containing protein n=1 Tax=Marinigracilibium pacificum TaxID=2729599 RepID=A0A848IZS8_9BACT|nr:T9SS type A sorting domain-containing protein [Marinigracilibium pacificum]NMM48648.1 T9SS type A sorting domain-containing protein [Marinigracilibium pacificum]
MKNFLMFVVPMFILAFNVDGQVCTFLGTDSDKWQVASNWSCGFVPNGSQAIDEIIISADVTIPNNTTYNFSSTSIAKITIQSGNTLTFGSNSKLILPSGAEIDVQSGALLEAGNNSSGTLIEIGGNGVWGRGCESDGCTNSDLNGPLVIDENSIPGKLPVELISFSGESYNDYVELEWATASEENFNFFTVERSLNGIDFTSVNDVYGKGGSRINYYSYTDEYSVKQTTYYRLKATDYDGFIEYHPIIAVYPDVQYGSQEIAVYPNPLNDFNNRLIIDLKDNNLAGSASMAVFNSSGQLVFEQGLNERVTVINNLNLNPGIYVAKIQHEKGQFTTKLAVE